MNNKIKVFLAFVGAVIIAGTLGSIFQSQVNLAQLREIGPPISFAMRTKTTWQDLINFAPLYMLIVGATLVITTIVAEILARKVPGHRMFWLVLAAVVGLAATFQLIDWLAPMPTFIAATRTIGGTLMMLLGIAIASVAYCLMTPQLNSAQDTQELTE